MAKIMQVNTFIMQILEDYSPYYLSFNHNTVSEIQKISLESIDWELLATKHWELDQKFRHERLGPDISAKLLSLVPKAQELQLIETRVSLFISRPGLWYQPHKDGNRIKINFGINYPIIIKDKKCITNWYDDDISEGKQIDIKGGTSTEVMDFDVSKHVPLCSAVMNPLNPVLFNTGMFHNWDNSQSSNVRVLLTFRSYNPDIKFQDAKDILFDGK